MSCIELLGLDHGLLVCGKTSMFVMRIHVLSTSQLNGKKRITFDVYILVNKSASNAFISSSESGNKSETYVYYFSTNQRHLISA